MSLVGNLEDLGLGDILQIVSLSRKSGILTLESRGREGKVVFRNGQVVRAASSVVRENLGDLLLRKELIDIDVLKRALLLQQSGAPSSRLGTILTERFGVPGDAVEEAAKEQIERVVYSFFAWNEGTFAFELGDDSVEEAWAQPAALETGLNPQWLAMEGSRLLDERRHRVVPLEDGAQRPAAAALAAFATAAAPADRSAPPEGEPTPLFLVDDDGELREALAAALGRLGFAVSAFAGGVEALDALSREPFRQPPPVWLIDLLMPRMDGSGMLGGLELAERVRAECPETDVVVISDHASPEAEERLHNLGFPGILSKPHRSELRADGPTALQDFAAKVAVCFRGPVPAGSPSLYDFGAELLREMGEPEAPKLPKGPESPGLPLLKGMLQELHNPSLGGGIILLILRFASELMNRAVIFLVKDEEIVGLGQFGIELPRTAADERVRRMKIPLTAESVFRLGLREKAPLKTCLGNGRWDTYLREQLDRGGLLLWVRTYGAEGERQATEILRRWSAEDVHVHELPKATMPREGGMSHAMSFMNALGL